MFVKSKNISQNMVLIEETETEQITLAKISTEISEAQKTKYIIRVTEFCSKNDNYSFKVEILKQFSKYLKLIEEKEKISFREIRVKCRNVARDQSLINLKLIQKTFAPLLFQQYAVFFYDENNNQMTLRDFIDKPNSVGNLHIKRKP